MTSRGELGIERVQASTRCVSGWRSEELFESDDLIVRVVRRVDRVRTL